jgi:hypothetical protein
MFEFLLGRHISDTTLIQYRAGLLDKKRFDILEAHLLLCPTCQLQLLDLLPPAAAYGLVHLCGRQDGHDGVHPACATSAGRGGGSYAP